VNDLVVRGFGTIGAASHMEARGVKRGKASCEGQTLSGLSRNERVEGRDTIPIKGLQGASEHVIIEMGCCNARSHEPLGRFVVKKARDQVALLIDKAQPIADHRFDGLAKSNGALGGILDNGVVHNCPESPFLIHSGDQAERI
jgi:hypothetical protein